MAQDSEQPSTPKASSNEAGNTSEESSRPEKTEKKHPKPKQIIRHYIDLLGGYEAIGSIQTVHKKATVNWRHYKDTIFESFSHSDGFYTESYDYTQLNQFFVRTVRDGVGWEGFTHLTNRFYEGEELKGYLFRTENPFWCIHWEDQCKSIDFLGIKEVEGKKAYLLKMVFKNGFSYENYFDIESGMLFRSVSNEFYQGKFHENISTVLDTKRVNGILMTRKLKIERDGEPAIYEYFELDIDQKLPKDQFDFPSGMDKEKILKQQELAKKAKDKNGLPPPPPLRILPARGVDLPIIIDWKKIPPKKPEKLRLVPPKDLRLVPTPKLRIVPPKELRIVPPKNLRLDEGKLNSDDKEK